MPSGSQPQKMHDGAQSYGQRASVERKATNPISYPSKVCKTKRTKPRTYGEIFWPRSSSTIPYSSKLFIQADQHINVASETRRSKPSQSVDSKTKDQTEQQPPPTTSASYLPHTIPDLTPRNLPLSKKDSLRIPHGQIQQWMQFQRSRMDPRL